MKMDIETLEKQKHQLQQKLYKLQVQLSESEGQLNIT